ncbi:hypothetical protein KQI63_04540 [bacterium]|nr:hypothetical protein [bacterium]
MLLCSLLAMILVSGCATFITTSTATQVDRWNRTIEPVPLDQLLTLHKGDHLLITLQDETELEGKLQSIRLDTSLVVRSGSWILGHQNQTIHRSDLMYVRLIQQPIRRRMTGVILGLPVDAVGAYYGFVFSALVILIITFIFNGPGTV